MQNDLYRSVGGALSGADLHRLIYRTAAAVLILLPVVLPGCCIVFGSSK